jgi:hypothetical protein
MGQDPVELRDGMGAKTRASAMSRLQLQPGGQPLLVVATGPLWGEGFDCPAQDPVPRRPYQVERTPRPVRRASSAPTPAKKPPKSTTTTTLA